MYLYIYIYIYVHTYIYIYICTYIPVCMWGTIYILYNQIFIYIYVIIFARLHNGCGGGGIPPLLPFGNGCGGGGGSFVNW